jgi:hypothetical protein
MAGIAVVPWSVELAPDGIEVVFGSAGYDTAEGYRLVDGGLAMRWDAKGPAARVAAVLGDGWAPVRARTALARRLWVVHRDAGGGFLTRDGYETVRARRAAEHFTRTYERCVGERYKAKSNGSCGRHVLQWQSSWCCTCGAGGFGEVNDRASAQQRAKAHREDPAGFPGRPWNAATVAALRAERAL